MSVVGEKHIHVVVFELFLVELAFAKVIQSDLEGNISDVIWIVCSRNLPNGFSDVVAFDSCYKRTWFELLKVQVFGVGV